MTNSQKKFTLFIADTHLTHWQQDIANKFLIFLRSETKNAEALYILGDFFMLWAGDDDNCAFNQRIKIALKEITSASTPIYIMPGNRDFLLNEKFAEETGCITLKDPHIINLYGRPTLLTHGDRLCSKDTTHLKFRDLTRREHFQKLFFLLPIPIRKSMAWLTHGISVLRQKIPYTQLNEIVKEESLRVAIENKVTQIIHGHLHHEMVDEIAMVNSILRKICLGNWTKQKTSALFYYEDGNFKFLG